MGKKLHFNVSSYTARLIGRENVANLEGAIIELVKNTYDADASICILYYEKESKTLYLMDNGTGMTEGIIEKHWMTIGNSSKSKNFITKNGRIQTGAKGIGRFALDRVSDNCVMYTKNEKDKDIIQWVVNWKDFEKTENLTDITAEINNIHTNYVFDNIKIQNKDVQKILEENFNKTGTIFQINNLREEWNTELIEKIRKSLSSLIPPDIEKEFIIYLFEDNQKKEEAIIKSENIDNFDYKIKFDVTEEGKIQIVLNRNEFDFKDKLDEIIKEAEFKKEDKEYFTGKKIIINTSIEEMLHINVEEMGKFSGTLYFNKIAATKDDTEKFYYKDITGRKNYSDIFGGIKLYRDNFRVRPYGEKNSSSYDWLLLGNRRAKSPAAISHKSGKWRVSADQITGIVNISRMNVNLSDQANREGIVETPQFVALKEIILNIIEEFEKDRQYVGRKLNELYEKKNELAKIEKEIAEKAKLSEGNKEKEDKKANENKSQDYNNAENGMNYNDTVNAKEAKKVLDNKDEKIRDLQDENRMLRNLATTGIVCNQYIHETKEAVNNIGLNVATSIDLLEDNTEEVNNLLEEALKYIGTLNSWFAVTIGSIKRDKRSMKNTNIATLVSEQIKLWREVLKRSNIEILLNLQEDLKQIKCFPYEIESILSNLIANSVAAFRGEPTKKIKISLENTEEGIMIQYQDTGKGLTGGYKKEPKKILEAFETDKRNALNEKIGTGMGMWIIKNITEDYDGNIDLQENKENKKGFYIKIELKTNSRK